MGNTTPIKDGEIAPIGLREALEERYLAYALSTIMHRALPDVRDGLKPVHRRLLYAMRELRLDPGSAFKKCARVVGDVIGKFHPHGDQAVYDALVRLAQDFSQRYPLIDGQGNFGNVDGDDAAAYRYTEARLTDVAALLLEGIDEDAVDFRPTYNAEDSEPVVLPAAFPNLLANGASGIAVGMATSIPPHNVAEICDAALHLIAFPEARTADLLRFLPGPDFPTGGVIVDDAATIREAYETGRGAFRLRARWRAEDQGRGTYVVVVDEIPYQVQKGKLIERIADLVQEKKAPLLDDVRDESAADIRIVLTPKSRNVDPALLMESLFRLTDLEVRVPLNMNVLSHGRVPNVLPLDQVLRQWLDHRRDVLVRRSRHRLKEIEHRLEILGGLLVAYLNLDEVIRIIREEDEPKSVLMSRFSISDVQATAILDMRLRHLRKLEEMEIRREHEALEKERGQIQGLLASDVKQWKVVAHEIRDVRKTFGPETKRGKRRTIFSTAPEHRHDDIKEALVEREPITIVVSTKGWIRALKGHIDDLSRLEFKQGDALGFAFKAETTDKILVFSTAGRFYTLEASRLPGGRGQGEPIRLLVDLEAGQDVAAVFPHAPEGRRLVATKEGRGFLVPEAELVAATRKGKQVLTLSGGDQARLCVPVPAGADYAATVGENRKMLVFPLSQVPQMTKGAGVRLQRFKEGGISDARAFRGADGLAWTDSSGRAHQRSLEDLKDWIGDRAGAGRLPPPGFPKSNRFEGTR